MFRYRSPGCVKALIGRVGTGLGGGWQGGRRLRVTSRVEDLLWDVPKAFISSALFVESCYSISLSCTMGSLPPKDCSADMLRIWVIMSFQLPLVAS